jgi:hypothetical protein
MKDRRAPFDVYRDIRHVKGVIDEIFLDQIPLVSQANHEIIDAMGGVDFHDMPDNRPPPNLDHRLGFEHRFFAQSGADPSGEYHSFHALAPDRIH